MTKAEVNAYIHDTYDVEPSFLWKKYPGDYTFRHTGNNKWFGLIMTVEKRRLGTDEDGLTDILNVKADPDFISMVTQSRGYYPGYHMNKQHWLTVCLDGSVPDDQIMELIDTSFDRTKK